MNTVSTPVTQALDTLGEPYRVFVHPGPVKSLAQAAEERGQVPQQIVRSTTIILSSAVLRRALPDYELVNLRPSPKT